MRLLYLCISIAMLSTIILSVYAAVFVIPALIISEGIFKYWLFLLFAVICSLPPIIGGGYFMARAMGQNHTAIKWLSDSAIALIGGLYWVGLFFVFETLVPPPSDIIFSEVWFTAGFVGSSIGLILTVRLIKYLRNRSISRT